MCIVLLKLLRLLLLEDMSLAFGKEFIILQIAMNQKYSESDMNMHKGKTEDDD